jgi:hypothetical protein
LPDNAMPRTCDTLARRANRFVTRKLGVKSFHRHSGARESANYGAQLRT